MKKRITVTVAITACFALCAAVWPQTEMVKETPVLDETTTVSAPKATVEELKTEVETVPPTEKERLRFCSRSRPRKPLRNRSLHPRKHPQLQKFSSRRSQHLSRKCLMLPPRIKLQNRPQLKQPLNLRPATWSM